MTDQKVAAHRDGGAIPDDRAPGRAGRARRWAWRLLPWPILGAVAAVAWMTVGADPERIAERARAEARAGDYVRAAKTVERLGRLRTPTPDDHLLRAQIAGGLARFDDAVAELRAIPDGHALGQVARLSEGQVEARRRRLRPAEEAFVRTLALWPDCIQARRELVYIYSVQRRLDRLDEQLGRLAEFGALDRTHALHWGRVRHVPWSPAADLAALERFVAADPEDRPTRLSLTDALTRLNRLDEADSMLDAFAPSDADALVLRARLAEARGDSDAVDALLSRGPEDQPELARMRGRRAILRRDGPAALRNYRIALTHDPHDRETLFGLATALTLTGRDGEARPFREEVRRFDELSALLAKVDADPRRDDPLLARRLGLACAGLGRAAEARVWLDQAISRDPLDAEAHRGLYRLDHPQEIDPSAAINPPLAR